jgi:hypothetical protein
MFEGPGCLDHPLVRIVQDKLDVIRSTSVKVYILGLSGENYSTGRREVSTEHIYVTKDTQVSVTTDFFFLKLDFR